MPDAKDNAKMTGDTHPPDVESDLPFQEGTSGAFGSTGKTRERGKASERAGRPGRGIHKSGLLRDTEEAPRESGSGESSRGGDESGGGNRG